MGVQNEEAGVVASQDYVGEVDCTTNHGAGGLEFRGCLGCMAGDYFKRVT